MRPIIAERLRKREGATSVNAGLHIQAEYPISGGYITSDGTIVVNAELDFFLPFTFILRPQLNSKNEVEWTCGVAKQEQFRYIRGYTVPERLVAALGPQRGSGGAVLRNSIHRDFGPQTLTFLRGRLPLAGFRRNVFSRM